MTLPVEIRKRVEEMVRPLYAGLDGVQTFDRVDRLRRHLGAISEGDPAEGLDGDLLELLLLLHGVVDRLGSLAGGGRLDLFLRGLGLPDERVRRVRAGLGRLREAPLETEERLLHDALLLESAGVTAAAERLLAAGRKRTPLARALAQLDPGPAEERYRTVRGRQLGAERRQAALRWIEELRRKVAEEGSRRLPGHILR
ncbi:MAG: uncharacterized protein QOJ16_4870 [Acidobacteriota bacterium]|jgi:hypothetical protein|nr:uncharacterized protein [Acidobacteriota bacterium]